MIAMRKMGLGLVLLSTLATTASADKPFHTNYRSNGVLARVDFIDSETGCIETEGTLLIGPTDEGVLAGFFGTSTNICELDENGQVISDGIFDFGPVQFSQTGLQSATTSGSFTGHINNDRLPDLEFEFAVTFTGTGPTITEATRFDFSTHDVTTNIGIEVSRRRAANVTGSFTVNGQAIELLSPFLGSGVSGEINVNH